MSTLEELLGSGAVVFMPPPPVPPAYLSTGFFNIDAILDGGLPKSSIIELAGEPSSGKTTLVLGMLASTGGMYINPDHDFDVYFAKSLKVTDDVIVTYPSYCQDVFASIEMGIRRELPLIVVDTAAGIVTEDESLIGRTQALSTGMKYIQSLNSETVVIFTNQLCSYNSKTKTVDSHAVRANADLRMCIRRRQMRKDIIISDLELLYSKFMPTLPSVQLVQDLNGGGYSKEIALLDYAVQQGIVICKRGLYTLPNESTSYHKKKLIELLTVRKDIFYKLWERCLQHDISE